MTRWTRCGIYSPRSNSTAITVKKNRSNQWSILSSGRLQSTQSYQSFRNAIKRPPFCGCMRRAHQSQDQDTHVHALYTGARDLGRVGAELNPIQRIQMCENRTLHNTNTRKKTKKKKKTRLKRAKRAKRLTAQGRRPGCCPSFHQPTPSYPWWGWSQTWPSWPAAPGP